MPLFNVVRIGKTRAAGTREGPRIADV